MRATAEKIEKNKVKLRVEVDAQTFEDAIQKAYLKNRKQIIVPGFRKGRAPRKIIERYYGESIFYRDAVNEVLPKAYDEAVKETGIDPVDFPEIDIVQIGQGQNFIFTADVTVKPEVELGQYKGIEVEKVEYNITEEDVEKQISEIRESNARWVAVEDRPVQEGDRVTLDYSGTIDGKEFPGGSGENYSIEVGSDGLFPGFEEQLIGMRIGEEKEFKLTFPEDYAEDELKGKEATFKVKIKEIKQKELPALDDEFARDVSEFDTLEELKADLKERMIEEANERAKMEMENQLVEKVVEGAKVDIPEVMVENEIDEMINTTSSRWRFLGLDFNRYLELTNTSVEQLREQYRDEAYNRVKVDLVLEKIAKVEGIEVTEEDIEKEICRIAERRKQDPEELKKIYKRENLRNVLKEWLIQRKTIDFLMDNAVFIEKKEEKKTDAKEEVDEKVAEEEKNE